ncbi:OmpP1/FadL family transporter [Photobacterium sp. DNB22_13_2]
MKLAILSLFVLSISSTYAAAPAFTRLFAAADSAETAYLTPAGMTRLSEHSLVVSGLLFQYLGEFDIDESLTTVSGGAPDSGDPILVPSLYYVRVLDPDWRAGVALTIPSGFGSTTGGSWAGRYYTTDSSLILVSLSPSVAYRIDERYSVGVGLNINYTLSEISSAIANSEPSQPDGNLDVGSDGLGVALVLSALIEWSPSTRFGINWHSESNADSDPDVKISGWDAPDDAREQLEAAISSLSIASKVPAQFQFGSYHRLDNDWEITFDAIWVNFSEFGVTEISVVDNKVVAPDNLYEDFWVFTAGLSFPLSDRIVGRVGGLYAQPAISDENRSFSFALDRIYGLGAGIQYEYKSGDKLDINLNLFDTGRAPIDTGEDPARGRIVGEYDDHYAWGLEVSYHW